jgi:hypothetical protein|tara:strand:+ start:5601 stop:5846 length:246 start_codon:yes stop_codon:yes gene_type:complete
MARDKTFDVYADEKHVKRLADEVTDAGYPLEVRVKQTEHGKMRYWVLGAAFIGCGYMTGREAVAFIKGLTTGIHLTKGGPV